MGPAPLKLVETLSGPPMLTHAYQCLAIFYHAPRLTPDQLTIICAPSVGQQIAHATSGAVRSKTLAEEVHACEIALIRGCKGDNPYNLSFFGTVLEQSLCHSDTPGLDKL